MACIPSFLLGIPYCFQSGFRTLTFINKFCTVLSTAFGVIFDVLLFYFSGKFTKNFNLLSNYTNEKLHPFIPFCLKFCVIPFTLVIVISWVLKLPSILRLAYNSNNIIGIILGICFNFFIIAPSIYFFIKPCLYPAHFD